MVEPCIDRYNGNGGCRQCATEESVGSEVSPRNARGEVMGNIHAKVHRGFIEVSMHDLNAKHGWRDCALLCSKAEIRWLIDELQFVLGEP